MIKHKLIPDHLQKIRDTMLCDVANKFCVEVGYVCYWIIPDDDSLYSFDFMKGQDIGFALEQILMAINHNSSLQIHDHDKTVIFKDESGEYKKTTDKKETK